MKKLVVTFMFFLAFSLVKADQLAYITLEQAKKAVTYLDSQKENHVLLWCACCDSEGKKYVKIISTYYRKVDYKNYYEVVIEGVDSYGNRINLAVDLAYVHVKRKGKYHSLGKVLKFESDPCTKPFKWNGNAG